MSAGANLGGVEEALLLLGRLEESDRRWILEHLPAAARARLADGLALAIHGLAWPPALRRGIGLEVLSAEPAWPGACRLSAALALRGGQRATSCDGANGNQWP